MYFKLFCKMFFLGVMPIVITIIGFTVVVGLAASVYPVATGVIGSIVGFFLMFGVIKYANWISGKISM